MTSTRTVRARFLRPWPLLALLTACTRWHLQEPIPASFQPRDQVQVWQGDHSRLLHGVWLDSAYIHGTPFQIPLTCDSCEVSLARASVDSLRLGNHERTGVTLAAVPILGLVLAIILLRGAMSGD